MFSFVAPVLLIGTNIFCLIYLVEVFFNFNLHKEKYYHYIPLVLLAVLSYFTLYHGSRYKEIFEGFEKREAKMLPQRKYARIYIISTIILLLATLVAADIRVDGHL